MGDEVCVCPEMSSQSSIKSVLRKIRRSTSEKEIVSCCKELSSQFESLAFDQADHSELVQLAPKAMRILHPLTTASPSRSVATRTAAIKTAAIVLQNSEVAESLSEARVASLMESMVDALSELDSTVLLYHALWWITVQQCAAGVLTQHAKLFQEMFEGILRAIDHFGTKHTTQEQVVIQGFEVCSISGDHIPFSPISLSFG